MKRIFLSAVVCLIVIGHGFTQNTLTQEQLATHATALGVPQASLHRLVESYRIQTALTHPSADMAQFLTINELRFRQESNMLEVGTFYRIHGTFQGHWGRRVEIWSISPDRGSLSLDSSIWITIPTGTIVNVILSARDAWGSQHLNLVDIAVSR